MASSATDSAGRVAKYASGQIAMTPDINGGTIDGAVIGGGTAAAGSFTTLSASGVLTASSASNAIRIGTSCNLTTPPAIGGTTPAAGAFTTLSATGQITSTVSTGTAPLVIASTTAVANLNASLLLGGTWAIPGSIGATTPAAGAFTTLSSSGAATLNSATVTNDLAVNGANITTTQTTANLLNTNVTTLNLAGAATTMTIGAATSGTATFRMNQLAVNTATGAGGVIAVQGDAGQVRVFRMSSGTSRRWEMRTGNTAESGADAGSEFLFTAYTDAAAFIDNPISIVRAAGGTMTLSRPVTMSGDLAVNGGDITSSVTTFNFLTSTVTTLNMGTTAGTGTLTTVNGRTIFDTTTTTAEAAIDLKQDDADEPFIKFTGTSAANTANNITTWTVGATLTGYVRVAVGATDYWMPYYTAPTS